MRRRSRSSGHGLVAAVLSVAGRLAAAAGGIMDDERLLVSMGAWHRGQRHRVPFETSCYYTHEEDLPHGCQYSRSTSSGWRDSPRRTEERGVLMSLYKATGGPAGTWRASDNWNETSDPCWDQWYGVTCDEHGHVIALELADNGLDGFLPSNLGRLTSLLRLDVSTTAMDYHSHENVHRNRLRGQLPSLADAKRIEEIEISGNEIEGLPEDLWTNGPTLRSLSASNNRIATLPRFLRRFVKLHTLELAHNEIADAFPDDFGALSNARFVHLQYNRLQGAVGPSILGMRKIRVLDLSHNPGLRGELPDALVVEWKENEYLSILNTSTTGYLASLCLDVPFCWNFMFDTHKDLTWAVAGDVPDIVGMTLDLARSNPLSPTA